MNRVTPVFMRTVRRTTCIGLYCLGLLAGLALVQCGWRLTGAICLVAMGLLVCICLGKKALFAVPAALAAGLILGIWQGSSVQDSLGIYREFTNQKIVLTGTVIDDSTYGNKGQRDMRLHHIQLHGHNPPGSVRVTSFTSAQPRRGDVVRVTGKLYDGFGNYQAAVYFADLTVVRTGQNPIDTLRREFAAIIHANMPDMEATLGLGILLGIKGQLSDTMNNQLQLLSLTHIVVASGYNLTVLIRLARRLFATISKYQTVAAAGSLMAGFVLVTGFSASMTRAALVSGLCLAAWYYGRRIHPAVLLLMAAALTAGINPLYIWHDLGWWLSFLAFSGVLLLAPLIHHRLYGDKQPRFFGQIIIETCAAQIMTVPLTLAIFGNFSVLGLLANVLIVPLVPLAMLLTFITGVAGSFMGLAAAYVALPAVWLLTYMTNTVQLWAGIPWASVPLGIHAAIMVFLYAVLAMFGLLLWRRTRHDFLARSVIE